MYVLRANGAVIGHDTGIPGPERDIKKLHLYSGDAIVVPEKNVHPSGLNQLMIWSQVLSQLSLNSMEVSLLK
jgi:hypothetical protein